MNCTAANYDYDARNNFFGLACGSHDSSSCLVSCVEPVWNWVARCVSCFFAVFALAFLSFDACLSASNEATLVAPRGTTPDRLFGHLRPDQYDAVVSSGFLGRGYQGASKVLLPPFDEGRIWATAYSREQLRGFRGAIRGLSEGINLLTVRARTKTIELTGEAAAAFTRPRGTGFSYNVFGWLKGTVGTQRQFRGQLRYFSSDTVSSLDGSVLYTAPQLRVFKAGEFERLGIYGGTGLAVGWWLSNE